MKAHAPFDRSAIVVGPPVRVFGEELVGEIAVGAMEFDAIEADIGSSDGRFRKRFHDVLDFSPAYLARYRKPPSAHVVRRHLPARLHRGRSDRIVDMVIVLDQRSRMQELHEDRHVLCVHRIDDGGP